MYRALETLHHASSTLRHYAILGGLVLFLQPRGWLQLVTAHNYAHDVNALREISRLASIMLGIKRCNKEAFEHYASIIASNHFSAWANGYGLWFVTCVDRPTRINTCSPRDMTDVE